MTERTTVRLPDELLDRAKRKAAAEGRTLTSLIEEGLRQVVAEKRPARPAPVAPRISKAKGGFAPGITSLRDIQELEDIEYVERLKRL
jgi:predicted transcriptional regulator